MGWPACPTPPPTTTHERTIHGGTHDHAARADRDDPAHRRDFAYVADFANSHAWDPGVATARATRRRSGRRRHALRARRPDRRQGRADGVPDLASSSRPTRVVLVGSGSGVDRRRRHPLRARSATGTAIDYTADIRLGGRSRLIQPFLGGRVRRDRTGCRGRHAADAGRTLARRRGSADGRTRMNVAIVGAGISGLTAAYALRHEHDIRLFDAETPVGGHVKTVAVETAAGRSRSTPASSSTTSAPIRRSCGCSPSSASRRSRATCPWARPAGLRRRVQLARGPAASSPAGVVARPGHWRMFADILRFYRDARRGSTLADAVERRRSATSSTTGGFGPRFRDHFLVPITSAVWSTAAGADPRLPDRLPAALPRPPRPHRLRQGAAVADDHGRLDGATWSASWPRCRPDAIRAGDAGGRRRADRGRRRRPDRRRHRRQFDAVVMATHADDALALLHDADPRERARPRRLRVHDEPGRAPHGRAAAPPPAGARGRRGTWTRPTAGGPATALTMTYHMNRLQSLPGPIQYCVSVNPGDRLRPGRVIVGAGDEPPDLHVPDARGAGGGRRAPGPAADLVTPARTWATASTRTAAGPASRPRALVQARSAWSGRHEVAPARRRRPPPARPAVHVRAGARRLLRRARPRRARRGGRAGSASISRNRPESARRSATSDHLVPPADDVRAAFLDHLRAQGVDPDGWRITLVDQPAGRSATSSTRPASSCAGTRAASCGSSSSRSTTRTASGTCTRSARAHGGRTAFVASMDKAFYVSPFIEMPGGYTVRVRDEPRGCASPSTSTSATGCCSTPAWTLPGGR